MHMKIISWVKAAQKEFDAFPVEAKQKIVRALRIASEGEKTDIAKPMKGLGSGVFEIAFRHNTNAYRVVYAVQIGEDVWVIHAFQKKAKKGLATPKKEIDLIKDRIKWLKENIK